VHLLRLVAHGSPLRASRLRPRKIVPWSSEEARRFPESARNDADSFYAVFVPVLGLRRAPERDKAEAGEALRGLPTGTHLVFTGKYGRLSIRGPSTGVLLLDVTRPVSFT